MKDLAAKLYPYLSFIFYAEFILLGLVIITASVMILRRVMRKQSMEGDPAFDYERIAVELDDEIGRIKDLRNRIVPYPVDAAGHGTVVDEKAVEARVENKYKKQIEELKALATASAAAVPDSGDGTAAAGAEVEALKAELEKTRTALAAAGTAPAGAALPEDAGQTEELKKKVSALEAALAEYELFEEEFALVKKYKGENEDLRKRIAELEAGGSVAAAPIAAVAASTPAPVAGAPVQPMLTNDEIEALFAQMASGAPGSEAAGAGSSSTVAANTSSMVQSGTVPESSPDNPSLQSLLAEAQSSNAIGNADDIAASGIPAEGGSADTLSDEDLQRFLESGGQKGSDDTGGAHEVPVAAAATAPGVTEDNAEAMAEAGHGNEKDELLSEFEKLLGEKT